MEPSDYDGVEISLLSPLEAVRQRPHMYVGSDPDRYPDIVLALVVMDHQRAAHAGQTAIKVTITGDWRFRCEDDGLGMPPWISGEVGGLQVDPVEEMPVGGPHQGQLLIARAFAHAMTVTSTHDGRRWQREYRYDSSSSPSQDLGPTTETGTVTDVLLAEHRLTSCLSPGLSPAAVEEILHGLGWWQYHGRDDAFDLTLVDQR